MADDRFKYHQPTAEAAALHDGLRSQIEEIVNDIEHTIPECAERTTATRKLEEAMFWGNAAIARQISAKADE